jgi:O-antigen/teichoic acid export membrane protein
MAKVILFGSGLFTTALLARILSLKEMGIYLLVASIVGITSVVGQFGLGRVGVRRVSEMLATTGPISANKISWAVIQAGFAGALLIGIAMHQLIVPWIVRNVSGAAGLLTVNVQITLWSVAAILTALIAQTQRGFHNIQMSSVFGNIAGPSLILAAYIVVFEYFSMSPTVSLVVSIAAAISTTVTVAAFIILYKKIGQPISNSFSEVTLLYRESWPFWVASIGSQAIGQSDIWIVASVQAENEVAQYGAVMRLLLLAAIPTAIVSITMQSIVSDLHARQQHRKLAKTLHTSNIFSALPSITILMMLLLFPEFFLTIVFGEPYKSAAILLVILATGDMFAAAFGSSAMLLRMMDHERMVMYTIFASGFCAILIGITAAKYYGATGVAGTFAVSVIIQRGVLWWYAYRKIGIRTDILAIRYVHFKEAIAGLYGYLMKSR